MQTYDQIHETEKETRKDNVEQYWERANLPARTGSQLLSARRRDRRRMTRHPAPDAPRRLPGIPLTGSRPACRSKSSGH
jgi:hypothetical protein